MKKVLILLFICLMLESKNCPAQQYTTDSVAVHIDLFTLLQTPNSNGDHVTLHQSSTIKDLVNGYKVRNFSKKTQGFRVRLFFDNSQTARQKAIEIESNFQNLYPGVSTYRTYQNLYFKVAVGDFRTRTDAMHFLQSIAYNYPGAFIIKENIHYPSL